MSSLTQAVRVSFVETRGNVRVYSGEALKEWCVLAIPHGGYALGVLVNSCMASQADTGQPEIAHITAHYLRPTALGYLEVHIRTLRTGRDYSNLVVELIQKNEVKITAHAIFKKPSGVLRLSPFTLIPPSPYARRIPLHMHPSAATPTPMFTAAQFASSVRWAEDKAIRERNLSLGRAERPAVGGGGLEWGAWLEFLDPSETVTEAFLAFAADMCKNIPELMPKEQRMPPHWHPTMVLGLEFKARIPDDPAFSKRTLGLYSSGRFLNEGRHDIYIEVWTAPCAIGEGVEEDGWREKQLCLATSNQMALTVPYVVNQRRAASVNGKL